MDEETRDGVNAAERPCPARVQERCHDWTTYQARSGNTNAVCRACGLRRAGTYRTQAGRTLMELAGVSP